MVSFRTHILLCFNRESKLESKKKERRKEEKKKKESEQMESSDEDISEQGELQKIFLPTSRN